MCLMQLAYLAHAMGLMFALHGGAPWNSMMLSLGGSWLDEDDSSVPPSMASWQVPLPWHQMALEVTEGQPKHFLHMRPNL